MSKIVQAVNAMISNPEKITDVVENDDEYFFLYNNKFKWSIRDSDSGIIIYFYSVNISIRELAGFDDSDWYGFKGMVVYKVTDIGTKEAFSSFQDLYNLVKEKLYGVDAMLDEIIKDDVPF
ncbi:hypothetical protein ACXZ1M_03745 [Duganella sp. PWIR1]